MPTRKAVSVLLTREPESTEVYLVERNSKLKFFGGYYAFPGGTLDAEDRELHIEPAGRFPDELRPYVVAAAREVFEETGILLSRRRGSFTDTVLSDFRKKLLAEEMSFAEILAAESDSVDAEAFETICKIITPEFSPVRYETTFLWAQIPEAQAPQIWEGELQRGEFFTAERALKLWKEGKMLIVPPLIIMLEELVNRSVRTFSASVAEVAQSYLRGKVHRVFFTPGIQMLPFRTRTLPPATHTNTYVVGESELYIVDPAPSDTEEKQRLLDYLDDLVAEGHKLKAILLTHHHSDHVGCLNDCQAKYDLPILAHEQTAAKLPTFNFSKPLRHGDSLDLGESPDGQSDWRLSVFHTPGHASGHLAFQESRYGAVIAGDLISTVSTIVISPPDGHLATYLDSLRQLQAVTSGTLYPSHGPAIRDGQRVIQYYMKHREQREEKLLRALDQNPKSASDLVGKVYDDVDSSVWPLAERSLRAGLVKLIEEGKCQEVQGGFMRR